MNNVSTRRGGEKKGAIDNQLLIIFMLILKKINLLVSSPYTPQPNRGGTDTPTPDTQTLTVNPAYKQQLLFYN